MKLHGIKARDKRRDVVTGDHWRTSMAKKRLRLAPGFDEMHAIPRPGMS
jgi:hypothetical protein